jgi:hypothetical protein
MKKINLVGQRYGRLVVVSEAAKRNSHLQWNARCDCGNSTVVAGHVLRMRRQVSCGCLRDEQNRAQAKGVRATNWRGGKRIDDGYVLIYQPTHPRSKSNGYVREHTLVMEAKIGRYLLPGENVHHQNGVKDDNRPENLELWSHSQPSGQRVADKIAWAKEILSTYGTDEGKWQDATTAVDERASGVG